MERIARTGAVKVQRRNSNFFKPIFLDFTYSVFFAPYHCFDCSTIAKRQSAKVIDKSAQRDFAKPKTKHKQKPLAAWLFLTGRNSDDRAKDTV